MYSAPADHSDLHLEHSMEHPARTLMSLPTAALEELRDAWYSDDAVLQEKAVRLLRDLFDGSDGELHAVNNALDPDFDVRVLGEDDVLRWMRLGRSLGRTLYLQSGEEPSDDDIVIGMVDHAELAAEIAQRWNEGTYRRRTATDAHRVPQS